MNNPDTIFTAQFLLAIATYIGAKGGTPEQADAVMAYLNHLPMPNTAGEVLRDLDAAWHSVQQQSQGNPE